MPSVTLTTSVIGEKTLCVESVPSSFLAFPFAPEELRGKLDAVCKKSLFGARYEICGVTVDEKRFVLGSSGVTCEELDILSAVTRGEKIVSEDAHMYASAINTKLASERAGATIKYLKNQGYRLVNENE